MHLTFKLPLTHVSLPANFQWHAEVFVAGFLKAKGVSPKKPLFCEIEKIYTLGRTSAVVMKASYGVIGESPYVRILKYDYLYKLVQEEENWKFTGGDRQGNIFIPRYENPVPVGEGTDVQGNAIEYGMLPITEASEATMADTVDVVINYIYDTYREGTGALRYQGTRIGKALAHAFDTLFETMYQAATQSDETLPDYFSRKMDDEKRATIGDAARPLVEELAKQGVEIEESGWPIQAREYALTAHRAIHGDLNPGNILICEGRGLLGLFTVLIDLMEVNREWKPLYWDAARLECEIILSFYEYLHKTHSVPESELFGAIADLINILSEGRVSDLYFDFSDEKGRGNYYLYTIFRTFRLALFNHPALAGKKEITRELLYRNHLYAAGTFYRFFLKWEREPGIKRKCALAASRAVEELYQCETARDDAWYGYRLRPDGGLFNTLIRGAVRQYIPIEENVMRILEFCRGGGSDIFWVEGYIGSGKTSLMAYCISLINGTIQAPPWSAPLIDGLEKVQVIPWFLSPSAPTADFKRHLFTEIPRFWPGISVDEKTERTDVLLGELSSLLVETKERLILFMDGVDVDPGVLALGVLPSEEFPNISIVFSGRASSSERGSASVRDLSRELAGKYRGRVIVNTLELFSRKDCIAFFGTLPVELIPNDVDINWIIERSGGLPAYLVMIRTALGAGMTVERIRNSTLRRIASAPAGVGYEVSLYQLYDDYFTAGLDPAAMPVLYALAATMLGETISSRFIIDIIFRASGEKLTTLECRRRIGLCAGLLDEKTDEIIDEEGRFDTFSMYSLRHQSLQEYLEGESGLELYAGAILSLVLDWRSLSGEMRRYALQYAVRHCCEQKDYRSAASLLSDFEYLMEKTRSGSLEGIFSDYRVVVREAPADINDTLKYWNTFFRERAHILRRGNDEWPSYKILLQLAVEHADNSPVTIAAEKYLDEGKVDWVWLRRNQRPMDVGADPIVWEFLSGFVDPEILLRAHITDILQLKDGRILMSLTGIKIPRLKSKTLVCLRDGKLQEIEPFGI